MPKKINKNFSFITYILSFLTFILYKIPIVSKMTKKIVTWYIKTNWWKLLFGILVKIRKAFIILNALIAIYALVDITGFSSDNIIAGVYGLGATYVEILTSFAKGISNWLVKFLDLNVVPNIPTEPTLNILEHKEGSWNWRGPKENTLESINPEYYKYTYTPEPDTTFVGGGKHSILRCFSYFKCWSLIFRL
uniref:Uncharacterized protein n=1 Tax=Phanerochaete carnosa TaxID=231932 RepID=A0A895KW73_9APHY|nr:hypothetical protein K8K84_mgp067 [Phanerochaete carnosa]QRZ60385.1 hypothetical protein [Phanerochaete carnosa]